MRPMPLWDGIAYGLRTRLREGYSAADLRADVMAGVVVGVVALQDLKEYLGSESEFHSVIAYDVMRPPPRCLTPSQRLMDALPVLLESELRNVPVVNSHSEFRLIGAVRRAEALGLLSEAITARTMARG